jgi:tyrosyl-tRNA synthetase
MLKPEEQLKALKRGTDEIITEEELAKKLENSYKSGKPLKIKAGFDPSCPDIHIGNAVPIRKLRQFQDLGHEVIFLIGDFTGMIGDPSQQSDTRKRLSRDEVKKNAETYKQQIFKILHPQKTIIDFNSRWCSPLRFEDVLELAAKYTVARLLERDDFMNRYKSGRPISMLEFLYPLVQGYDSVVLKADVELGGSDQKWNCLVAREIQREYGQEPEIVMTLPLLVGTDGTQKMSKSLGNYIGINESAREIFGKTMSIPDELILSYFELATDVSDQELEEIRGEIMAKISNPKDLKTRLAETIVTMYHSKEAATGARAEFERMFKAKGLPDDIEIVRLKWEQPAIWIVTLLKEVGLAKTSGEARRLVSQGGVYVDQARIESDEAQVPLDREFILQVGKRRFVKVSPANR